MQPWKVEQSRYLIERSWMRLREDRVILPNQTVIEEFHVVEYPNWAATVCIDVEGRLILVEQYRHGVGRSSLELPAGVIENGENPLDGARRELLEETGYTSIRWDSIGRCATDPSNHSNYAYLFVAKDAYLQEKQALDAEEEIVVRTFSLDEVLKMMESGEFIHGIHMTAILWALRKGMISSK